MRRGSSQTLAVRRKPLSLVRRSLWIPSVSWASRLAEDRAAML